ncbi:ATP-grasp domain-containing protein [Flavisphingomonas formosensis]|uniref:ATP-grasp domain-containing protein n=1 Tax=Flavisphingomonas formosensis TaxID=861534 RepID=UPI0012FB8556|nr:ATP-grasp domain-containing protein [Sphingomonas formosensis]
MPTPFAIFCADPLDPRSVEPDFANEVEPARSTGFNTVRLDHDNLDRRVDPTSALRKTRFDEAGKAVYRGWMLSTDAYAALFAELAKRGIFLLTTPEQYTACHHAPGSYAQLAQWMPATAWQQLDELDDAGQRQRILAQFGASPLVIKDWVKSQASGYWREACYINDASDTVEVDRVVSRFRELQGESIVGGIVFKSYVPLLPIGGPAHEYRAFIVDGQIVGCWPRSDAASALGPPPQHLLQSVAEKLPSPFASADFGRDTHGRWWLLEVGDGQVSSLPTLDAATAIFNALAAALR